MCAMRRDSDASPRGSPRRPGGSAHCLKYKAAAFKSPQWKNDFRRRCLDRIKTSRCRLADASRPGQEEVRAAMDATWREMQSRGQAGSQVAGNHGGLGQGQVGGQIPGHAGHGTCLLEDLVPDQITDEDLEEYERSVADMEADLRRLVEEAAYVEDMGAAILEVPGDEAVTCPVCKLHALEVRADRVSLVCACGVDLSLPAGACLRDVYDAVTCAVTQHLTQCDVPLPDFGVLALDGGRKLAASCPKCDYLQLLL